MKTIVQLYSARNYTPWDSVLDQIKIAGYDGVEGFGGVFEDPESFRAELDKRELGMPTGHFSMDMLENNSTSASKIARILGISTIIMPWLPPEERPTDHAGWQAVATRLAKVQDIVTKAGFAFGYHNHDFEIAAMADGKTGMDVLLDSVPGMRWEADLGWIIRAGDDPLDWIASRSDRIVAVHLKDVQPDFENAPEDGWADLGHGVSTWSEVFAALAKLPNLMAHVAEHDNPSDLGRFLSRWKASEAGLVSEANTS